MELLNIQEQERLKNCELVIQTGLDTFYQVGQALLEIQENKLYRQEFNTFDEYLQGRWNFGRTQAYNFINSAKVISNLKMSTIVDIPTNENQTRYLAQLEPDLQGYVWSNIINTFEAVTGKIVEQEVKKHKQLNEAIKEVKSKPMLYQFETQEELIEKAKSLIPAPAPVVQEIIKHVEIIKDGELMDKLEQKDVYINQLKSSLSDLEKLKSEKYSLERQLQATKNDLQRLEALDINEDKVNETMQKLITFEQRQKQLSEAITISNEMIKVIVDSRKFFAENLLILNELKVTPDSLDNVRNTSLELSEIVENWLIEFKNKFNITSNNLRVI